MNTSRSASFRTALDRALVSTTSSWSQVSSASERGSERVQRAFWGDPELASENSELAEVVSLHDARSSVFLPNRRGE